MSDTAVSVLQLALKDAEAHRDKVARATASDIEAGRKAQALLDDAETQCAELAAAILRLERTEAEPVVRESERERAEEHGRRLLSERPEVEDMQVAGVRITRRRAE